MQPLLKVQIIKDGQKEYIVLNENHVAYVKRHPAGFAILVMSNGEELVAVNPSFIEWEGDTYIRKE